VSEVSRGGSCFIGKNSWNDEKGIPGFIVPATPYCGWSHGIYYTKPGDALGPKEQAMVIADIDPLYMNEGKPRPQMLPVPLQLVAHLPIAEIVDGAALLKEITNLSNTGGDGLESTETSPSDAPSAAARQTLPDGIVDIQEAAGLIKALSTAVFVGNTQLLQPDMQIDSSGRTTIDLAEALQDFFSDKSAFAARIKCWKDNWRQLPYYGPPPTIIDWLSIDLTPRGPLPSILVPPWTPAGTNKLREDTPDLGLA
jgi:hypothetical protein